QSGSRSIDRTTRFARIPAYKRGIVKMRSSNAAKMVDRYREKTTLPSNCRATFCGNFKLHLHQWGGAAAKWWGEKTQRGSWDNTAIRVNDGSGMLAGRMLCSSWEDNSQLLLWLGFGHCQQKLQDRELQDRNSPQISGNDAVLDKDSAHRVLQQGVLPRVIC